MEQGTFAAKVVVTEFAEWSDGRAILNVRFMLPSAEEIWGRIWFEAKAGGDQEKCTRMARKALKAIGFDPEKQTLEQLQDDPNLLAGNECDVELEEYNGKMQVKYINALGSSGGTVEKPKLSRLTAAIRSAKSKDEAKPSAKKPEKDVTLDPPF